MKSIFVALAALSLLAASPAEAQGKKFAGYVLKSKTSLVEGVLLVDGYSPAELAAFLREDCASGQIGPLKWVGKPYSKRGHQFQKFQTSCEGGPSPRIGKTKSVSVEIELMPEGRNMTEYTYGSGGQIQYSRYIR